MENMFFECRKLKDIKGLKNFNNPKVTITKGMFSECNTLEYVDLSNFNISKVTDMECMFFNCKKLKEIKGFNMVHCIIILKF